MAANFRANDIKYVEPFFDMKCVFFLHPGGGNNTCNEGYRESLNESQIEMKVT